MIDRSKVKLGEPLPGYRFKPGECIVNSDFADEFREGICTQKELDDLKMLVVEVGIERITQNESSVFCTILLPEGMAFHGIRFISGD
jgi:hypothetical protein